MNIGERVKKILNEVPNYLKVVAATKGRSTEEINEAIESGINFIGENYLQEAESKYKLIKKDVKWHFIGHLQKNKVKKVVRLFDMIETLDSLDLAEIINKECSKIGKVMPVLIEINSAGELQKSGVLFEDLQKIVEGLLNFKYIKVKGLMTMGPVVKDVEEIRPFFIKTKEAFEKIKSLYKNDLQWEELSMGMSDTYRIAIEEGATIVRIGRAIFEDNYENKDSF
ncbi:MAG: YggS family pyridoxal phosphate-dependent enzyme [Candidatus Omnitrophica bacterium]|nr:YggS family pyridoxal phosphate-dependent enzyme [Candidatus Omnitrophota bacterium]